MADLDKGRDVGMPADNKAPEAPRGLKVAELRAAASRARSGEPEASPATETPNDAQGAVDTKDTGSAAAAASEPAKSAETPAPAVDKKQDGKEGEPAAASADDLDPLKGPGNPFWSTQLGRKYKEDMAALTAQIADLQATIKLMAKKSEPPAKPSGEIDIEAELGIADPANTAKPSGDGAKPSTDPEVAQAEYTKAYLSCNAEDEFKNAALEIGGEKVPVFAEVMALMFNKEDPNHTFNRPWTGNPKADYRLNFTNAMNAILARKVQELAAVATPKPGADKLKGEAPTVPLGVGGDVKGADDKKPPTEAVKLDGAAKRYLAFVESKGRDPEKLVGRTFAVNMTGAATRGAVR
jgi:hypothetical protein